MRSTLVQVARLYYEENLSQQRIADHLGVSRPLIAQYLQRARDAGIVRIQVIGQDDACAELARALENKTGVQHVKVVPNPSLSQELADRAVAAAAADFLTGQIRDYDTLGLAWGRAVFAVVDELGPPAVNGLKVLPLMGEYGRLGTHSHMSQLVERAAKNLHAAPHFLSLPIVVSKPTLRDDLLQGDGIREVVDMWNRVNLACVGIRVVPPSIPGMVVYIGEEHLPQLVEAGAVGDFCGIYYDRDGQIIETGLETRMIGADVDQLRAIDCLIAVACGVDQAVAVLGALRTGLISALFIDQNMAEQILTASK